MIRFVANRLSLSVLVLLTLVTVSAPASASAGLRDDVERLVRVAPLKGAKVAVSIREGSGGSALVSFDANEPLMPASNMKMLTTGAALHVFGPDFEFVTRMLRDGDRLVIVGSGDPAFGDPALLSQMTTPQGLPLDVEGFLRLWVDAVKAAGITRVSEIVVDDRVFDREFIHSTWPMDQLNRDYCAQVAGLNFHANVLHFHFRPRSGMPPDISDIRPRANWLKVTNNASSNTDSKARHEVGIARKLGTNDLLFRGNVKFPSSTPLSVTFDNPPAFFAQLMANRLTAAGVDVQGYRVADVNDPPATGQPIGPVIVTPLRTIVTRCNQESDNLYAEAMLKRMGHDLTGEPGSWMNGGAVLRHVVHERLADPGLAGALIVADGCGLSRGNKVTAALMTAWLESIASDPKFGEVFIDSLAVGAESGTLRRRYQSMDLSGAVVQAKTGFINSVSCLSGFVTAPDGRRRSFSVLINGFEAGTLAEARKLQDQIVRAIAQDLAKSVPATRPNIVQGESPAVQR